MTEVNEQATTPELPSRAELANSGLTNRNQLFMHQVVELATEPGQAELAMKIQAQLLEGQKSGQTARQMFGTPAQALGLAKQVAVEEEGLTPNQIYAAHPFWQLVLDNAMAFGMLFMVMFGFMLAFSSNVSRESAGAAGLTSLIGTAVFGAIFFSLATKFLAAKGGSRIVKFLGAALLFVAWFGLYLLLAGLPAAVNPIMPGWVYLVLAAITFFAFRYWRARTKIVGGFLGGTRRPRNR
ncbi:DUF1129 family protein [Weissella muntiaci]|uniref:DUF1129 family protein n=1 Tax=Weissella muntiaci TaxID=2508881 RepID=A0A6C2C5Y8_9LACO|nr:DUF1129 family protein [Weissella muntiaci]TYC48996.1 DUF1129 family protein [Weissella muntiaci]